MIKLSANIIFSLIFFLFAATFAVRADGTYEYVCTPIYGMADSCVEHQVVETAGESNFLYTLSGLSYFAGLISFIKAKLA
jgi:hypothetical protein